MFKQTLMSVLLGLLEEIVAIKAVNACGPPPQTLSLQVGEFIDGGLL